MKSKFDTLLITKPENVRYLSGFTGEGVLLCQKQKITIITDPRYELRARQEMKKGVQLAVQAKRSDEVFKKTLKSWRSKQLGFEAAKMTVADLTNLKKRLRGLGLKFIPTTGVIEELRRVKSSAEIKQIATACGIADRALAATLKSMKRGVTELAIAEEFRRQAFRRGAEDLSFDSIVAFGENSGCPHAKPSVRKLKKGDVVQFDIGVKVGGYCSDMSRVLFTAAPTVEQRRVFDAVSASQLAGAQAVRAGAVCGEIDATCRGVLVQHELAEYFTHSTGHGVGLDIHEWPNNSPQSKDVLVSGHVVTVEPGVYLENKFGMRIEDTVLVQARGAKILTNSPKKLRILKI